MELKTEPMIPIMTHSCNLIKGTKVESRFDKKFFNASSDRELGVALHIYAYDWFLLVQVSINTSVWPGLLWFTPLLGWC